MYKSILDSVIDAIASESHSCKTVYSSEQVAQDQPNLVAIK